MPAVAQTRLCDRNVHVGWDHADHQVHFSDQAVELVVLFGNPRYSRTVLSAADDLLGLRRSPGGHDNVIGAFVHQVSSQGLGDEPRPENRDPFHRLAS